MLLLLVMIFGLLAGLVLYRFVGGYLFPGTRATEARAVTPRGDLAGDEKATIELFRGVSPSVVYITTLTQRVNLWTRSVAEIPQGTGSGFVWDDGGDIVTNFHVVRGASGAQVTLNDHETYDAQLVGTAPEYDLAVVRINVPKEKLHPILVGSSHDLQVGQKTFAIGNPFGLDQTLTTGIVSALGRTIKSVTDEPIEEVIQTDAAINPGNSGGPLLDSAGRLIGVNTAIYSPSGSSAGIGFAIPVDTVNRVVPQLVKGGKIERPNPGLLLNDEVSQRLTRRMGVEGVMILGVEPNSPAEAAGLKGAERTRQGIIPGDVIQKVDGKTVKTADDVYRAMEKRGGGGPVKLTILREGQLTEVEVGLGK